MNPAWREQVRRGDRLCASCQETGACRYGIDRLWFDDASSAMAIRTVCPPGHQGGPGVAHGGWICSVMDELLGENVMDRCGPIVTANLSVDFRKPVTVGEPTRYENAAVWAAAALFRHCSPLYATSSCVIVAPVLFCSLTP